ncbi:hypothetical protein [Priestia megaterium]|uniref:hypothetical protein n=1 Tax=Priestia megaterium TaxID=1404 RepID=UPI002A6AE308|nr:hypothetical protein [Priestia megaterium]MDY0940668.1 hypothetical protein [Priestia megaterium]
MKLGNQLQKLREEQKMTLSVPHNQVSSWLIMHGHLIRSLGALFIVSKQVLAYTKLNNSYDWCY